MAVNGQPARGTYAVRGMAARMSPNSRSGRERSTQSADTAWPSMRDETYEILQSDGTTPVGTIMTYGLSSGTPSPPGPPAGSKKFRDYRRHGRILRCSRAKRPEK